MIEALCKNSKSDFMRYEDELSSKREEFRAFLCTVRGAVRDILALKKGIGNDLVFFECADEIKHISKTLTLMSVSSLLNVIEEALNSNEQNANVNLLKINFMNAFWKCVH